MILAAQSDDFAHDLGVKSVGFRLRVNVADITRERGLFFLKPLDALDKGLEFFA